MKSIVDGMVVEGKTVRNALVAVFALVVGAAMPSFAADRVVSGSYQLTANEDWSGGTVTLEADATVDLAGFKLVLGIPTLTDTATFTDTSADAPGELRFTIPENETFEKTAGLRISGNLSLVKDGPGTFLWSHDAESALSAAIPVLVINGVFKIGATTGNLFGASGTVTVKAPGQFDINTTQKYGPASSVRVAASSGMTEQSITRQRNSSWDIATTRIPPVAWRITARSRRQAARSFSRPRAA